MPTDLIESEWFALRPAKNPVDAARPYAFLVEPECTAAGIPEDVATVFLTNCECPFRCLFCDLWLNTTDDRVPPGAIPAQIDYALARLPPAQHLKLYNSGNFFDAQAIPPEDFSAIANRVRDFKTVIVENHPRLCGPACTRFRDLLLASESHASPELEVALGLETIHPEILPRLNKQMTLDDFQRATDFLHSQGIAIRAFILLKPPFMGDKECVDWALRSIEFAFDCGARICAVIPTRSGNGVMNRLERTGQFAPPALGALEAVLEGGLALGRGRVFVDLWNVERIFTCNKCGPARADRLRRMNLSQRSLPACPCSCQSRSSQVQPACDPRSTDD